MEATGGTGMDGVHFFHAVFAKILISNWHIFCMFLPSWSLKFFLLRSIEEIKSVESFEPARVSILKTSHTLKLKSSRSVSFVATRTPVLVPCPERFGEGTSKTGSRRKGAPLSSRIFVILLMDISTKRNCWTKSSSYRFGDQCLYSIPWVWPPFPVIVANEGLERFPT